ncbi:hypothetical protein [Streptomyces sp. FH025]|uniref:hypothetical protein n=1 Tax=Streptomyces sp. FH025 TaxID=2815937 RepID=UPI001A9D6BC3|nr:hypothetical protein [Streptomyces sp. FH025]MBO1419246.1 hypothetical protein [Streptomyces sp. FH025]
MLSGTGTDPTASHALPVIELRLTRKTLARLEGKIRAVLHPTVGTGQPFPQNNTAPRRGRISVEEIPPSQLQFLEHAFRMTFSGIEPDPYGECPPPVIEMRLSRKTLDDLDAQIRAVRLASVVNAGRAANAEPPLARRAPGRALQEHFSTEQIEQLHQDHTQRTQVPTEDVVRILNGLRQMEVTP